MRSVRLYYVNFVFYHACQLMGCSIWDVSCFHTQGRRSYSHPLGSLFFKSTTAMPLTVFIVFTYNICIYIYNFFLFTVVANSSETVSRNWRRQLKLSKNIFVHWLDFYSLNSHKHWEFWGAVFISVRRLSLFPHLVISRDFATRPKVDYLWLAF